MKLAIASDEISFDFETAVTLGLEWGVELFELKRLNRRRIPEVDEADLKVVESVLSSTGAQLTSLAPGLFKGALDPATNEHELKTRLEGSVALAHRFDVQRIIVFGFEKDGSRDPEQAQAEVVDVLGAAADRAMREGIVLLLENEPAFWADCPEAACAIIEGVNSPSLQVNWDPCNSLGCPCGAPYPAGYEMVKPYVRHVHVKDARLAQDGSVEYVVLGSGEIDWEGQFSALLSDRYAGYCVLEPHFGNRVVSSRAAVTEARRLMREARRLAFA